MMWAKIGGWLFAHKDAIIAGVKTFIALRKRRKETQESGESSKEYYVRKVKDVFKQEYERL